MGFDDVCSMSRRETQLGIHKSFAMAPQLLSSARNLTLRTSISVKTLGQGGLAARPGTKFTSFLCKPSRGDEQHTTRGLTCYVGVDVSSKSNYQGKILFY